jgi:hypothetical protein
MLPRDTQKSNNNNKLSIITRQMLYSVWRQRKQTELLQVTFLAAGVRAPISHARSADFSALFVCGGAALIIIILRATRMLDLEIDNRPMWGIC